MLEGTRGVALEASPMRSLSYIQLRHDPTTEQERKEKLLNSGWDCRPAAAIIEELKVHRVTRARSQGVELRGGSEQSRTVDN